MDKYRYKVIVTYIDAKQNKTIKDLLRYGLWSRAEAKRKERPSTISWEITGDSPMTKDTALKTRIKFTKQFVANGERIKSITFQQIGSLV